MRDHTTTVDTTKLKHHSVVYEVRQKEHFSLAWFFKRLFLFTCCCCGVLQVSCGSAPCLDGYKNETIDPTNRRCQQHCDCSNQVWEAYCLSQKGEDGNEVKLCSKAIQRGSCSPGETDVCVYKPPKRPNATCKGVRTCQPPGMNEAKWGNCEPDIRAEVCNGDDDDCDGSIDEGLPDCKTTSCQTVGEERPCFSGIVGCVWNNKKQEYSCKGECRAGVQKCQANKVYGPCKQATKDSPGQVLPSTEVCDNKDNDCDGDVDEDQTGAPLREPCYESSQGGCTLKPDNTYSCQAPCRAGLKVCKDGTYGNCQQERAPTTEICNNKDDDCNGKVDDSVTRPCYSAGAGCVFQNGTYSCMRPCQTGTQRCVAGRWESQCEEEITPRAETCNGQDEDCDGKVDNIDTLGQRCTVVNQKGVCAEGRWGCHSQTGRRDCLPVMTSKEEVCNGKDDNCDGMTDNIDDLNKPCTDEKTRRGVCQAGIWVCQRNQKVCLQTAQPQTEVCDGKDNDCNGLVDDVVGVRQRCEDNTRKGICRTGVWVCENNKKVCKQTVFAAAEECNGFDDDCDGIKDNVQNIGQACSDKSRRGECRAGVWACDNNKKICKQSQPRLAEVCDGKDNDCDGFVDNISELGKVCQDSTRNGICRGGRWACESNKKTCKRSLEPKAEVCNGKDDNCDGLIDNITELGNSCTNIQRVGRCQEGKIACEKGKKVCKQSFLPIKESCNKLDDDCDGQIDEPDNGLCCNSCQRRCGILDQKTCTVCCPFGSTPTCRCTDCSPPSYSPVCLPGCFPICQSRSCTCVKGGIPVGHEYSLCHWHHSPCDPGMVCFPTANNTVSLASRWGSCLKTYPNCNKGCPIKGFRCGTLRSGQAICYQPCRTTCSTVNDCAKGQQCINGRCSPDCPTYGSCKPLAELNGSYVCY